MSPESVLTVGRQALEMMLIVSAPPLLVALVVGLVIGLLQAVTQVNEATLTFLPKLIAVCVSLLIAGPWMITLLTDYIQRSIAGIPGAIGP